MSAINKINLTPSTKRTIFIKKSIHFWPGEVTLLMLIKNDAL